MREKYCMRRKSPPALRLWRPWIQVTLADGKSYTANVLATDPQNDLAVVGISAPAGSLHPAKLGDPLPASRWICRWER